MKETDSTDFPPTQYLVLELLAARYRLGHDGWTLSTQVGPALQALEDKGMLSYKSGVMPHTYLAWLTEKGRKATLMDGYVPPILGGNQ